MERKKKPHLKNVQKKMNERTGKEDQLDG